MTHDDDPGRKHWVAEPKLDGYAPPDADFRWLCEAASRLTGDWRKPPGERDDETEIRNLGDEFWRRLDAEVSRQVANCSNELTRNDAQDIAQEVMMEIFTLLQNDQDDIARFLGYALFRLVKNRIGDRVRKISRRREEAFEASVDVGDSAPSAEQALLDKDEDLRISEGLSRLPGPVLKVWELRCEGKTLREIAQVQSVSIPTAHRRYRRCLDTLRKKGIGI